MGGLLPSTRPPHTHTHTPLSETHGIVMLKGRACRFQLQHLLQNALVPSVVFVCCPVSCACCRIVPSCLPHCGCLSDICRRHRVSSVSCEALLGPRREYRVSSN